MQSVQATRARSLLARSRRSPEQLALAVAIVLVGALILIAGRHLGFFYDDWDYVTNRRAISLHSLFAPHNGHPSVTAVVMFQVLFAVVGLGHYVAYIAPVVLLHLGAVVLVFLLARERIGERAALIPALLLLLLSASSQNMLWAAQETYMGSISGGLLAFLLIGRNTRRADIGAAAALIFAVFSSTLGVPFLVGIGVELALRPERRRALWIPVVPLVLYGLWTLGYQTDSADSIRAGNLAYVTGYVADIASAAAAGIAGLSVTYGPVLLVGGALAVALARMRESGLPGPTPRLAGLVATALSFWVLTALARAQLHEPAANRYVYLGSALLMLIAAEVLYRPRRWTVGGATTAVVLLAVILLGDVYGLRAGERELRANWDALRPELAAVEVAGAAATPAEVIDAHYAPLIAPRRYLPAVAQHGSPTGGLGWLRTAPESRRETADVTLARFERVNATPGATGAGCPLGTATTAVRRIDPGTSFTVASAPGAERTIQLRRFGAEFATSPVGAPPRGTVTVTTAPDSAPAVPWVVRVTSPRPVAICAT